MQDMTGDPAMQVTAAAEEYCRALWTCDTAALAQIFHERANLYAAGPDGLIESSRQAFLDRAGARAPGTGEADFTILSVDVAAPEMAHVKLEVAVSTGARFTDYLNFLLIDGTWRVIAKVFHPHRQES